MYAIGINKEFGKPLLSMTLPDNLMLKYKQLDIFY
jgi:hypothetical protein